MTVGPVTRHKHRSIQREYSLAVADLVAVNLDLVQRAVGLVATQQQQRTIFYRGDDPSKFIEREGNQ